MHHCFEAEIYLPKRMAFHRDTLVSFNYFYLSRSISKGWQNIKKLFAFLVRASFPDLHSICASFCASATSCSCTWTVQLQTCRTPFRVYIFLSPMHCINRNISMAKNPSFLILLRRTYIRISPRTVRCPTFPTFGIPVISLKAKRE